MDKAADHLTLVSTPGKEAEYYLETPLALFESVQKASKNAGLCHWHELAHIHWAFMRYFHPFLNSILLNYHFLKALEDIKGKRVNPLKWEEVKEEVSRLHGKIKELKDIRRNYFKTDKNRLEVLLKREPLPFYSLQPVIGIDFYLEGEVLLPTENEHSDYLWRKKRIFTYKTERRMKKDWDHFHRLSYEIYDSAARELGAAQRSGVYLLSEGIDALNEPPDPSETKKELSKGRTGFIKPPLRAMWDHLGDIIFHPQTFAKHVHMGKVHEKAVANVEKWIKWGIEMKKFLTSRLVNTNKVIRYASIQFPLEQFISRQLRHKFFLENGLYLGDGIYILYFGGTQLEISSSIYRRHAAIWLRETLNMMRRQKRNDERLNELYEHMSDAQKEKQRIRDWSQSERIWEWLPEEKGNPGLHFHCPPFLYLKSSQQDVLSSGLAKFQSQMSANWLIHFFVYWIGYSLFGTDEYKNPKDPIRCPFMELRFSEFREHCAAFYYGNKKLVNCSMPKVNTPQLMEDRQCPFWVTFFSCMFPEEVKAGKGFRARYPFNLTKLPIMFELPILF